MFSHLLLPHRCAVCHGNMCAKLQFSEIISNLTCYDSFKAAIAEKLPDYVVSVHPLCQDMPARIIGELNATLAITDPTRPSIGFCTVVSDLIDCHQTWFNAKADAIFVPTKEVRDVCVNGNSGADPSIIKLHGLPIRPAFWNPKSITKESMRKKLGLHENKRTVLLMAGGDGVGALIDIVVTVANKVSGPIPTQLIVICGSNKVMAADLSDSSRVWPTGINVVVQGFVQVNKLFQDNW